MKWFLISTLGLVLIGSGSWFLFFGNANGVYKSFSTFENFATEISEVASAPFVLGEIDLSTSTTVIVNYPKNNQSDAVLELLDLVPLRSDEEAKIFSEYYGDLWSLPTSEGTLSELVLSSGRVGTKEIIESVIHDVGVLVASEQLRNDVARPYQIDLRLLSEIPGSKRPSYPSEIVAQFKALEYVMQELNYQDDVFYEALKAATEGVYTYGLNTKIDGDYAEAIARAVVDNAKKNHPSFDEFLTMVGEREFTAKSVMLTATNTQPFELSVHGPNASSTQSGMFFEGVVINIVATPSPEVVVELQIDQYADGSIDDKEQFIIPSVTNVAPEQIQFFTKKYRAGLHQFRFVIDPENTYWGYEKKLNNVTAWQPFTIE